VTVLVLGLDGLDARYVKVNALLRDLGTHQLHQNFNGDNALYTYRVWNNIFAGELGGESYGEPYVPYEPHGSYVWEKFPAEVFLAPVVNPSLSIGTDAFPREYIESYAPGNRLDDTLTKLNIGVRDALKRDVPLVVACTRTPDIVGHHVPNEARYWINRTCYLAERLARRADEYLIVSDHGFDFNNFGGKGIEAHTRRATFASSFCDFDSMTEFCKGWHEELASVLVDQQMDALGYK